MSDEREFYYRIYIPALGSITFRPRKKRNLSPADYHNITQAECDALNTYDARALDRATRRKRSNRRT